jgi:pyrroline-5-carboxylate reductase
MDVEDVAWQGSVGIIGAGSMAQALVGGLVGGGFLSPRRIWATNRRDESRLRELASWGVRTTRSKADVCRHADVLVLAVKPKDAAECLAELRGLVGGRHLVVSVMAGIGTSLIEGQLGEGVRVVRAMPNTSSAIRESATAIAGGRWATAEDLALVATLLGAVGQVVIVQESELDAVTALSGSGPAYVYLLLECMAEAGAAVGLDPQVARRLALQTVFGSAKMARETGREPAELRARVASPGGTTVAALEVLERSGFREALTRAVARAAERSRELGQLWALAAAEGTQGPAAGSATGSAGAAAAGEAASGAGSADVTVGGAAVRMA